MLAVSNDISSLNHWKYQCTIEKNAIDPKMYYIKDGGILVSFRKTGSSDSLFIRHYLSLVHLINNLPGDKFILDLRNDGKTLSAGRVRIKPIDTPQIVSFESFD